MMDIANDSVQNAIYQIILRWIDDYLRESNGGKGNGSILLRKPALRAWEKTKGNFNEMIQVISKRYDVDPKLVHAVVMTESSYDPDAVSPAGAQGLMQLMPGTAKELGVRDALNPAQNLDGGTRLLRKLLDRYEGNVSLALAAYNAGPGSVTKYGGVPPYRETQTYVSRVLQLYQA